MTYQILNYFSLEDDCDMMRVSMFDAHGSEFWMRVRKPPAGRSLREAKERAFDAIQMAIDDGLQPGEVALCEPN